MNRIHHVLVILKESGKIIHLDFLLLLNVLQINQDFTRLFGEVVSGTFMAKWPTFFKPRVIADCKTLPFSEPVEDLLTSAQQESNDYGTSAELKYMFFGVSNDFSNLTIQCLSETGM